jgi:hypothetical protein
LTDKAMAADLKALTAQAQKMEASALVQLHAVSEGWWSKAVEQCDGRAKDRAQRNLTESQKASAILNEQLGNAPECGAAHKDAATLQELARAALGERRWIDAATLFHKAEDMWDLAAERCTGSQKDVATKRLEQAETDGYNAEFCAPLFDRAREQTQKLRASAAGLSREEKQDGLMVAETLWRDALAQCKGAAAQESARNNAQTLARERGTPWVARNPAPTTAAAPAAAPIRAVAQQAKVAVAATESAPKPPVAVAMSANKAKAVAALPDLDPPAAGTAASAIATTATASTAVASTALASTSDASPSLGSTLSGLFSSATAALKQAAPALVASTPSAQPQSFAVGDMHFDGQFVRDADAPTFSGTGRLRWANGDVFDGTLQNGKRQGKGLFVWGNGQRYKGDWVDDEPNGQAVIDFANGDHYEGMAEHASPKGTGSMAYASGDRYKGQFAAGQPNGTGAYVWKNGQKFEGDWKDGKPSGRGRLQYASGDVYEGTVRDGSPNQSGTFTWVSGDRYVGQWKAGRKEGPGVFTWAATGDRWEGVYENDAQSSNGNLIRKTP